MKQFGFLIFLLLLLQPEFSVSNNFTTTNFVKGNDSLLRHQSIFTLEKSLFTGRRLSFDNPSPKSFYLQNTNDASKKIRIRDKEMSLLINESKLKGDHISRFNTTECIIEKTKKDSIIVQLINEEIEVEYKSHVAIISQNYFHGLPNKKVKGIAVKDIYYINMKSTSRKNLTVIGRVIMGVSILAIISTPFVTMGIDESERTAVREKVILTSLSGFALSIPFFIGGKSKKYGISKDYLTRSNNYWQIKEE